ncbi:hypothetical protein [Mesorhizobium carmichaelinearum]|uniref:hypothetical protein n=1 Tax=Mesorhizobium carmichaelinearum TaxID=1208188 RepID=UPI000BA47FCD|nr:hypothetical protein [Mesorhizobium carmichaelinearum]
MRSMIMCALALSIGLPAVASAAQTDVIIKTHHRHHSNVKIINENGQRLHHRHHGTVAFYDHGRRHHRPDTVIVTGAVSKRHHHRPVVIENNDY